MNQRNDSSRKKEIAEIELIDAKIAESHSKRFRNYCGAVSVLIFVVIRIFIGV